jgi:hypothetical protein
MAISWCDSRGKKPRKILVCQQDIGVQDGSGKRWLEKAEIPRAGLPGKAGDKSGPCHKVAMTLRA